MADDRVTIHDSDMSCDMKQNATTYALLAVDQCQDKNDIATFIKKKFDSKYGGAWQCIAARNVGYSISNEPNTFIFLQIEDNWILLFKSH
ncbi:hypothetical protein FO519_008383 [Halicephalobus sp. NKZ332]|nr:hypothetical protein FO519_008383 [Halicephalobus sp. NKZ332]